MENTNTPPAIGCRVRIADRAHAKQAAGDGVVTWFGNDLFTVKRDDGRIARDVQQHEIIEVYPARAITSDPEMAEVVACLRALHGETGLLLATFGDDAVGSAAGNYFTVSANGIMCRAREFKDAARAALKKAKEG